MILVARGKSAKLSDHVRFLACAPNFKKVNLMEYVVGFLYNKYNQVLLIKKNKPEWQKGKLNGIGGKIELGETPLQAMIREFKEEAGLNIENWTNFLILEGKEYKVHFFTAETEYLHLATQQTEEEIEQHPISFLPENTIQNLRWIIPLSRDKYLKFPIIIFDQNISGE